MASILVVDDEDDERELICSWLEEAGHQVRSASSGESGIALVMVHSVEMAIVDIFMPGIGGLETIRRVRALAPKASIVAMSGYLHDGMSSELISARASSIEKPFSPDQLIQKVTQELVSDVQKG